MIGVVLRKFPERLAALRANSGGRDSASPAPGSAALLIRATVIAGWATAYLVPAAIAAAVLWAISGRRAASVQLARRGTALLERLGPAFIKGGQILSTRRDELSAELCDALARLQDNVRPLPPAAARVALEAAFGMSLSRAFAEVDQAPVASGSVACVFRATRHDGSIVAVKLRRPGIERTMAVDLALVRWGAGRLAHMRAFRDVPVTDVVDHVCGAIERQLDFRRECASLAQLADALSAVPRVWVPRPIVELSGEAVVTMDFIPDLSSHAGDRAADTLRRRMAATTLTATYTMLFVNGFVHCDMHPGNLYLRPRSGQVVILDAGFCIQMSERMRDLFREFFLEMAWGRAARCAEIVLESATGRREAADIVGFLRDMTDLAARSHGLPAREFSLIAFAREMFDLHRRCGLRAAPELVFPLLALLVIEGTVRELDPDIDFQETAKPILTKALFHTQHNESTRLGRGERSQAP